MEKQNNKGSEIKNKKINAIKIKNLNFSYSSIYPNINSNLKEKNNIYSNNIYQRNIYQENIYDYLSKDSSNEYKTIKKSCYITKNILKKDQFLSKNVLKNINLEIETGSFISILGPNGCGKSTLINIISKVLKNYSGYIEIFGRDLNKINPKDTAKLIAVVPQYTNAEFNFTVEEMVLMGRYPYISRFGSETNKDYEKAINAMNLTKTLKLKDKKYNELSGGEKQRVIIAQALAQETPIILLDEPTSHLDINFQIEIMNLFLKLNKNENRTIVGVFHDINLAANYSEKVLFLKDGSIFTYGDIESTITKENIKNVFDTDIYIGRNPFTGKIYISPAFFKTYYEEKDQLVEKNASINKLKKIHIICGGGAASPVLNLLKDLGYIISCGVVNYFDTDLDTAKNLKIPYISEAPFSPISLEAQNKNIKLIKESDIVIFPPIVIGNGNFSNLVSIKEAVEMGKKVIIINGSTDFKKRDYTKGKATKIYQKILKKSLNKNTNLFIINDLHDLIEVLEKMKSNWGGSNGL